MGTALGAGTALGMGTALGVGTVLGVRTAPGVGTALGAGAAPGVGTAFGAGAALGVGAALGAGRGRVSFAPRGTPAFHPDTTAWCTGNFTPYPPKKCHKHRNISASVTSRLQRGSVLPEPGLSVR